jgi:hypothetical protein
MCQTPPFDQIKQGVCNIALGFDKSQGFWVIDETFDLIDL